MLYILEHAFDDMAGWMGEVAVSYYYCCSQSSLKFRYFMEFWFVVIPLLMRVLSQSGHFEARSKGRA